MKNARQIVLGWVLLLQMCSQLQTASSFSLSNPNLNTKVTSKVQSSTILSMIQDLNMDRRASIAKLSSGTLFGIFATVITPQPSFAKSKEPVTPESMAKAFADVRFELEDPSGGIPALQKAIETKDWEDVKGFTKFYDLEFRKAKMVKARKMFPDSEMRGETLQLCNNVTFDLIGINRASRVEDQNEALKYLDELKEDVKAFLEYEKKVVIPSP